MITFAGQAVSMLELAAFVTGLLSVWLTQRMHVASWPVGLVNVACFAVLFLDARLYADALLQVAFFVFGVYGWWTWHAAARRTPRLDVTRARLRELGCLLVAGVLGISAVASILTNHTNSPAPLLDASILVLSLLATWLQAHRRIESWLLWIVVDIISIPLYWSRALPLTAVLYGVFLLICLAGFASWKSRLVPAPATA